MIDPNYVTKTQILQRVARNPHCRFKWSFHAQKQMVVRRINAEDVINALMYGHVTLEEYKQDILWRVDGKDVDGNRLEVSVAVDESTITIKVVTAF